MSDYHPRPVRRMAFNECPMCDGYGCSFCEEEKPLTLYQQKALQAALRRSAKIVHRGRTK